MLCKIGLFIGLPQSHVMRKDNGWEHLGELSRLLQVFRSIYLHSNAEDDDNAIVEWRSDVRLFFMRLLSSRAENEGVWIRFRFDPFCLVLTHSCCDWSSSDAFGCGLMSEVAGLLMEVQSELPVCTPAIVHVLLHRLATLRPGKEAKGQSSVLIAVLQQALKACPALPGTAVERSVEDCLRHPSPSATWSLSAVPMFVRDVLSLVTHSPRALGPSVIPLLLRFVSETCCQLGSDLGSKVNAAGAVGESPRQGSPCLSCVAAGAPIDPACDADANETPRCEAQERRDLVLEALFRWVVDAHFRRCSRLLQVSLHRAVCDGVQQVMEAAAGANLSTSHYCFPLACKLLLAFVGGVAGDGGVQVAMFLQHRCRDELRHFLTRVTGSSRSGSATGCAVMPANATVGEEFPVLQAYMGHLCLCRHISDATVGVHLLWLTRQALAIFRFVDAPGKELGETSASSGKTPSHPNAMVALSSLCHSIALLLTRPKRGKDTGSAVVLNGVGNLLEIIFDSDVHPLSAVPRPLAAAAVGVLQDIGHLQLVRLEGLLGPCPDRSLQRRRVNDEAGRRALDVGGFSGQAGVGSKFSRYSVFGHVDFVRAPVAFQKSWGLVETGVEKILPSPRLSSEMKRAIADECWSDTEGSFPDSAEFNDDHADEGRSMENDWERVPDEVALRVFSFLTPKRVCRLACVERAWRDLLQVSRVWRPLFEARWPLRMLKSDEELTEVSATLLKVPAEAGPKHKRQRVARARVSPVYHLEVLEDLHDTLPILDWMGLYRDRHKAERAARWRCAAKTQFPWRVCPFLGCITSLKSEFAVKRHMEVHKRPQPKRCLTKRAPTGKRAGEATAAIGRRPKTK